MKTTTNFFTLLFITAVLSTTLSCKQENKNPEKEDMHKSATFEELGQMNRDFAKAMNARDAHTAASLYDENASILPPNEPMVTGRANIEAYMQGFLDAGYVEGSSTTTDASSDGNLGYETGTFLIKMKGPDGTIIEETIKFIELLKRNEEGKWMSIYGMWSSNEPMPTE
tara:strand:+ start:1015 stop:1521 length:507 start_codon:yes stop_codon:yes gene_type:complete